MMLAYFVLLPLAPYSSDILLRTSDQPERTGGPTCGSPHHPHDRGGQ
jgi:hypothetical protein